MGWMGGRVGTKADAAKGDSDAELFPSIDEIHRARLLACWPCEAEIPARTRLQ